EPAGTSCGDAGTACVNQDTCNGTGSCTDNGFKPAGTPCNNGNACKHTDTCLADGCAGCNTDIYPAREIGSEAGSASVNQDTGNGSRTWLTNAEPAGTSCGDAGTACVNQDTCNGTGSCTDNGFKPAGTPCNDGNACTQTDTCLAGVCAGGNPVICTAL